MMTTTFAPNTTMTVNATFAPNTTMAVNATFAPNTTMAVNATFAPNTTMAVNVTGKDEKNNFKSYIFVLFFPFISSSSVF